MSERFALPPSCTGLNMEDGTRYNRNRRTGMVEVDNPDHIAAIKRSGNYTLGHMGQGGVRFNAPDMPLTLCDGCAFSLWPWQTRCPRCGAEVHGKVQGGEVTV